MILNFGYQALERDETKRGISMKGWEPRWGSAKATALLVFAAIGYICLEDSKLASISSFLYTQHSFP